MDVISWIWETYSNFTCNLPSAVFSFLLRANLLLLCPIIAAYIGFSQGLRSARVQTILMIVGVLVAISIPLHRLVLNPSIWRPWLVMILLIGCWALPVPFSYLAHPRLGTQAKVLKYCRYTLLGLFLLNIMFWG